MKNFEIEVKGCKHTINERNILNLAKYGDCNLDNKELYKHIEDKSENKDLSFSCKFLYEIYKRIKKMSKEED